MALRHRCSLEVPGHSEWEFNAWYAKRRRGAFFYTLIKLIAICQAIYASRNGFRLRTMVKRLGEVNIDEHHVIIIQQNTLEFKISYLLLDIVPSNKKMRRDCHSTRCWVVCFGMDLRPSDRCHDSGHMVLCFLTFKMSHSGPGLIYFSWGLSKGFLKSGRNPPTSGSHPVSLSSGFAMWMPLAATTWGISGSGLESIQIYRRLFSKKQLIRSVWSNRKVSKNPICLKFYTLDFVQNNSQKKLGMVVFGCVFDQSHIAWGLVERSVWHRGGVALCDTRLSAWVLKTFMGKIWRRKFRLKKKL